MRVTRGLSRGATIAVVIAVALGGYSVAYLTWLIQTLGYESRHLTYADLGHTNSGGSFGLKHMVFLEGQTFFADYDAEVRRGTLLVGLLESFGPFGKKLHFVERISASGAGEVAFVIPKTTLYTIYFEGSVLGPDDSGEVDVDYTVRWGAR